MVAPFEDPTNLALKGTCQQENLSLALTAVRHVFPNISEEIIQEGIRNVKHPCRFQICRDDLIIDGSHNPNGAMALRESLDLYFPNEIYFYHFNNQNSCSIKELQESCEFPSKIFKSLDELPQDYLKIVCGSFYMLNEIVPHSLVR